MSRYDGFHDVEVRGLVNLHTEPALEHRAEDGRESTPSRPLGDLSGS